MDSLLNPGIGKSDGLAGIYAHSLPDQPQINWQTLETHSNEVAEMASGFASRFGSELWVWIAGQLHDIGKADATFQAYLLRSNGLDDREYDVSGKGKVNHSSAGAAFAYNHYGPLVGHALAAMIAGHHAGLRSLQLSPRHARTQDKFKLASLIKYPRIRANASLSYN